MDADTFDKILKAQINRVIDILGAKGKEYARGDQLSNFKQAAHLQRTTMRQALAGMMAKHTVSIFDLIRDEACAPPEVWDEKIIDHINYLILLRAVVAEEHAGHPNADVPLPLVAVKD